MIHFNNKIVTFNNKIIGYEVITEIPGSRYHTGYTTQATQATADEVDNIVFDGLLFNNSISFVVGKEYGALMCWGS